MNYGLFNEVARETTEMVSESQIVCLAKGLDLNSIGNGSHQGIWAAESSGQMSQVPHMQDGSYMGGQSDTDTSPASTRYGYG